ncbi:MAG TPA: DUF6263 family protein [Gemmatimonadota bacterium]|nr:DUF6263 family protein [Gemmatimonadota bacterium]
MTSPLRHVRLLVLAAAAAGACSPGEADPSRAEQVGLRLGYEVGDTLHYRYHVRGRVNRPETAGGEPATESYERTMNVEEVATEVTPRGNYLLAWTYRPVEGEEAGEDEPAGFSLRVEITPQGKIIDVGDLQSARKEFANFDFKTYLDQTQPVFPERPLKVGDSWTQEVRVLSPQAEPIVTRSTYVLEDLDERTAVIAFDGDVYLPLAFEADSLTGSPPRTTEERIRLRGRLHYDRPRQIVARVRTTAQASVTTVTMGPEGPSRQNIDLSQESELTLVER